MRKPQHGATSKKGKQSNLGGKEEAEFNFGYFYRTVEEHVNTYAAQAGNPHSVTDIAVRVGRLLEAKALREEFGSAELVPQVRQNGAGTSGGERAAFGNGLASSSLHVRPRHRRTLSAAGRKRISLAQRERWAKTKKAQRKDTAVTGKNKRSGTMVPWTEKDDTKLVGAVRNHGRVGAPEVSRELVKRMAGRTAGAIRQRLARLVKNGTLKGVLSKETDGGTPHFMLEAA